MWAESPKGGFSSSALAVRKVLAFEQAYGIYLTDRRLIVTKENAETAWCWEPNGAFILGTVTTRIKPFLGSDAVSTEELDKRHEEILCLRLRPSIRFPERLNHSDYFSVHRY